MAEYPFVLHDFGWLRLHESRPALGARHLKSFLRPTAPADQRTLNLYVAGRFEWRVGDYRQELVAGQSNLDITLLRIPDRTIVTERPLVAGSVRYCLQPIDADTRWTRRRVDLAAGQKASPAAGGWVVRLTPEVDVRANYTAERAETVFVLEQIP